MKRIDQTITAFMFSTIILFFAALWFIFVDHAQLNLKYDLIITWQIVLGGSIFMTLKYLDIEVLKDICNYIHEDGVYSKENKELKRMLIRLEKFNKGIR